MFNFTTQTVYNEISTTGANKNMYIAANTDHPSLRIGNTRFDADDIVDVQIKLPTETSYTAVTFDMEDIIPSEGDTVGRIVLYIGLSMNSQDSFYANNYVYKGKPLFIEFPVSSTDSADVVANRVKKIADKYLLFSMGTEKILEVSVVATAAGNDVDAVGTVTFQGVNGYQQIKKALLQKWNPEAITFDCCNKNGAYEDVKIGVPAVYELVNGFAYIGESGSEQKLDETGTAVDLASNEVPIKPGLEAFGDYNWIIHNLRLPTLANTNFWAPTKAEMPVPGQVYTQFIIRLCKERDGISGEIVGARAKSVTTHVLYVAGKAALNGSTTTTAADKVYNALFKASGDGSALKLANAKKKTDADTKLVAPFE